MKYTTVEELTEKALKSVEADTGLNRVEFCNNSTKEHLLNARMKATLLLIKEAQLSDEGIAKALNVSKSTANTYRNRLGFHKR